MASVPKSQYDDLQKRHENMRKNREREQRRYLKLEVENKLMREALDEAIERMDRARGILTNGAPTPECNWGMLDTADLMPNID